MSLTLKPWQPADGCKSCKAAEIILNDHLRHQQKYHADVLKRINGLLEDKQALKQRLIDAVNELRDDARRGCYESNIAGNMDESNIFAGNSAAYTNVVELIENVFSEP